jgi:DNA polymerase I-like protein with 3'-5' exonuclease and polymerase domains
MNPRAGIKGSAGYVLLAADYSQIELRFMAHFSRDPALCAAFESDTDVFKAIAAVWKGISVDNVAPHDRAAAKQLCYGILYGMGCASASEALGTSASEAKRLRHSFLSMFPELERFIATVKTDCRKKGTHARLGLDYDSHIDSRCLAHRIRDQYSRPQEISTQNTEFQRPRKLSSRTPGSERIMPGLCS